MSLPIGIQAAEWEAHRGKYPFTADSLDLLIGCPAFVKAVY
jgi:hypothetical protein